MFSRFPSLRSLRLSVLLALTMLIAACGGASAPTSETTQKSESAETSEAEATALADVSSADAAESEVAAETSASAASELSARATTMLNGGAVLVNGVEYVFETERCNIDGDAIDHEGFGVAQDGTPFTARISASANVTLAEITLGQVASGRAIAEGLPHYKVDSITDPDFSATRDGSNHPKGRPNRRNYS